MTLDEALRWADAMTKSGGDLSDKNPVYTVVSVLAAELRRSQAENELLWTEVRWGRKANAKVKP